MSLKWIRASPLVFAVLGWDSFRGLYRQEIPGHRCYLLDVYPAASLVYQQFPGGRQSRISSRRPGDIDPVDFADILEELDHDQRVMVFSSLDDDQASETLEEIEPQVQRDIISSLTTEQVVRLLNPTTPGEAADIL